MTIVDSSLFTATPHFRSRRKRVTVRVQVAGALGPAQEAMVRDISAAGMSAQAHLAAPAAGELVTVALPDGSTLWGVVRWARGKAFGVEFDVTSRQAPPAGLAG